MVYYTIANNKSLFDYKFKISLYKKSGPRFQKPPWCYSNLHHSPHSTSSIVRQLSHTGYFSKTRAGSTGTSNKYHISNLSLITRGEMSIITCFVSLSIKKWLNVRCQQGIARDLTIKLLAKPPYRKPN